MSLFIFFIEYILFIYSIITTLFNDVYKIFILIILNNDSIESDIKSDNSKNTTNNEPNNEPNNKPNNDSNNESKNDNINNEYINIKKEDLVINKYYAYFLQYNIFDIKYSYSIKLVNYNTIFIKNKYNNNKDLCIFVEYFIYILNNKYILFHNEIIDIFDELIDNNKLYSHDELVSLISSKKIFLFDYLKKFETFILKWDKFNNILSCDANNRNIMHDACLLNDIYFIKGVILTEPEYIKKDIFGFTPVQYLSSGVRNDLILEY